MTHNFTPFPVLETDRLLLRALDLTDAKAIFGLRTNKEVNEFIDRKVPRNLSEARAFIDLITKLTLNNKGIFWVIASKNNDELMGTIGLRHFDDEDEVDYAEIGFEMDPDYQLRGYMSEAFEAVLNYGFQNLGLKNIEAYTRYNNEASIALLEKHKFVLFPDRRDEGFENNRSYRLEVLVTVIKKLTNTSITKNRSLNIESNFKKRI